MVRFVLSDQDWGRISSFFRVHVGKQGRPPKDNRMMLEAILWVHRTGAPWRDIPSEFGPWESAYTRFRRWTTAGLWHRILRGLRDKVKSRLKGTVLIDATIVRAHQHAAGKKGGRKIRH